MKALELFELAKNELEEVLISDDFCKFSVEEAGICEEQDDYCSVYIDVTFTAGNINRKSCFCIAWDESTGWGFEYGEDGEIQELSPISIWKWLYYDLVLEGLDEEYQL